MGPSDAFAGPAQPDDRRSLHEVLALEEIDRDIYRAGFLTDEAIPLYGGQVAAQGLLAAGLTVDAGRAPHSLHGYFLRPGDARRPTLLRVHRDRDGRSYSGRRVEALQDGQVIFSMAASFHVEEDGADVQTEPAPDTLSPDDAEPIRLPRMLSMEGRRAPHPGNEGVWPTRFWARSTVPLGEDPLLNACVLTYLSDISSGLTSLADDESFPGSSLDHAVWFHRPARLDDWVLMELLARSVAAGRGWYTGTVFDSRGTAVASIAQESLFRRRR
jgi:acyl-CoA thioesterase-2